MTCKYRPRFGSVVGYRGAFCGPSALSVVSGIDVKAIENLILAQRSKGEFSLKDKNRVVGMRLSEWRMIAEKYLGLFLVEVQPKHKPNWKQDRPSLFPTLAKWLRDSKDWREFDVYLVITNSHYLLICGEYIVDNQLHSPKHVDKARHYNRARVVDTFCVMRNV